MKILKSIVGSIIGWRGKCIPDKELTPWVLYYRPIEHRGFDQWLCWKAMLIHKWRTRRIDNFCQSCPHYVPMTSLESNVAMSEDCGKGHYRFEATN